MFNILAISNTMEHTDILNIIVWAGPIVAVVVMASAWYINRIETRALVHQLELQRLALLEETEQKKRDMAEEFFKNATSI